MLQKIEEQQENTLMAMNRLESAFHQKNNEGMAEKETAREARPVRSLLASSTKVTKRPISVADSEASQRRKEK